MQDRRPGGGFATCDPPPAALRRPAGGLRGGARAVARRTAVARDPPHQLDALDSGASAAPTLPLSPALLRPTSLPILRAGECQQAPRRARVAARPIAVSAPAPGWRRGYARSPAPAGSMPAFRPPRAAHPTRRPGGIARAGRWNGGSDSIRRSFSPAALRQSPPHLHPSRRLARMPIAQRLPAVLHTCGSQRRPAGRIYRPQIGPCRCPLHAVVF